MSDTMVRVLGPGDVAAAADVLARGFDQEPAKLSLLPDPRVRRAVLEMSARGRLYDAVRRGTAHGGFVDDRLAAVAVWVPPATSEVSVSGGMRAVGSVLAILPTVAPAIPHVVSEVRTDLRKNALALSAICCW